MREISFNKHKFNIVIKFVSSNVSCCRFFIFFPKTYAHLNVQRHGTYTNNQIWIRWWRSFLYFPSCKSVGQWNSGWWPWVHCMWLGFLQLFLVAFRTRPRTHHAAPILSPLTSEQSGPGTFIQSKAATHVGDKDANIRQEEGQTEKICDMVSHTLRSLNTSVCD